MFWQICCWRVSWSEYRSGRYSIHGLRVYDEVLMRLIVLRGGEMQHLARKRRVSVDVELL